MGSLVSSLLQANGAITPKRALKYSQKSPISPIKGCMGSLVSSLLQANVIIVTPYFLQANGGSLLISCSAALLLSGSCSGDRVDMAVMCQLHPGKLLLFISCSAALLLSVSCSGDQVDMAVMCQLHPYTHGSYMSVTPWQANGAIIEY